MSRCTTRRAWACARASRSSAATPWMAAPTVGLEGGVEGATAGELHGEVGLVGFEHAFGGLRAGPSHLAVVEEGG